MTSRYDPPLMLFKGLIVAMGITACASVKDFVHCVDGYRELSFVESRLTTYEQDSRIPTDHGSRLEVDIYRYAQCDSYSSAIKRWEAINKKWNEIERDAELARRKEYENRKNNKTDWEKFCETFQAKSPSNRCLTTVDLAWRINQVTDSHVVFVTSYEGLYPYQLLAVERDSFSSTSVRDGETLAAYGRCIVEKHDEIWKSARGFNLKVRIARLVPCNDGHDRAPPKVIHLP